MSVYVMCLLPYFSSSKLMLTKFMMIAREFGRRLTKRNDGEYVSKILLDEAIIIVFVAMHDIIHVVSSQCKVTQ